MHHLFADESDAVVIPGFVDPQTRRPVPLVEEIKAAMRALMFDA